MTEQVPTGISGLDELLGGGLRKGACALVKGLPGTGKTTIGMQFIYSGALQDDPGVIITFEQFPEQLYADAANFGWDLKELEEQGMLRVICTSPDVFMEQLSNTSGMVDQLIRQMGAKRILIDSLSHITHLAPSPDDQRSLAYRMINGVRRAQLTAMATKESQGSEPVEFEEYLADTVVNLSFEMGADLYRRRYLEITKSRGQNHAYGKHTLQLTENGARVFPRSLGTSQAVHAASEIVSTGVWGLDDMLNGGIRRGFTVLAAGSAGVGKTTLGLSFIDAGLRNEEPALFVSFEETSGALVQLAGDFGMSIPQRVEDGMAEFMHVSPLHLRTDEFISELDHRITALGARRVVIDSLTDLAMSNPDQGHLRETVYRINSVLKTHDVTSVLTTEVPELFGQTYVTNEHISIIVDGIILMKYLEMESEIQRAISVLKMRGCHHDRDIRRYTIDATGMQVRSRFEGTEGVMAGTARAATVTLSVRSFSQVDEEHNQELLQRFTQTHPRVRAVSLQLPYNPDEAMETVQTALQAQRADLSVAPLCMYWMPEIFRMNRLLPLDDLLEPGQFDRHMAELINAGRHRGRLYAIPAMAVCGVLLYRRDLLEEFGFDAPPKTWDELVEQARTIVQGKPEDDLIGYQFPAYPYEGLSTSFLMNLWSNGGRVYDSGAFSMAEEPTLEALTYMYELFHKHDLIPADMLTAAHGIEPQTRFLAGKTVFLTGLPSVAQAAGDLDSPVRGKVGIAPPPCGPSGTSSHTYLSSWHYGIPRGARAPQSAREFIKFMTSPSVQKERALGGGPLPSIEALYEDHEVIAFNPDYPRLLQMLRTARTRADIPHYLQVSEAIQQHVYRLLRGQSSPGECVETLRETIEAIVATGQ
ncbi:MAG: extracellular solute-binding protein [Armatimonadota bacterium]